MREHTANRNSHLAAFGALVIALAGALTSDDKWWHWTVTAVASAFLGFAFLAQLIKDPARKKETRVFLSVGAVLVFVLVIGRAGWGVMHPVPAASGAKPQDSVTHAETNGTESLKESPTPNINTTTGDGSPIVAGNNNNVNGGNSDVSRSATKHFDGAAKQPHK